MRLAGHVAQIEIRNAFNILVGKPERKRALGNGKISEYT
jgi:hypothetical protein